MDYGTAADLYDVKPDRMPQHIPVHQEAHGGTGNALLFPDIDRSKSGPGGSCFSCLYLDKNNSILSQHDQIDFTAFGPEAFLNTGHTQF